jgi:hypothetical protein
MIKKPLAVGLKVREKAVVESKTGNVTLVNCLRKLKVKGFPATTQPLFAFVSVTDALLKNGPPTLRRLCTSSGFSCRSVPSNFPLPGGMRRHYLPTAN